MNILLKDEMYEMKWMIKFYEKNKLILIFVYCDCPHVMILCYKWLDDHISGRDEQYKTL